MGAAGEPVAAAAREAFVSAWTSAMWVGVAIAAAALAWVALRGPARAQRSVAAELAASAPDDRDLVAV